jgi:hypothetical protein
LVGLETPLYEEVAKPIQLISRASFFIVYCTMSTTKGKTDNNNKSKKLTTQQTNLDRPYIQKEDKKSIVELTSKIESASEELVTNIAKYFVNSYFVQEPHKV